jgi:hypothetical protein
MQEPPDVGKLAVAPREIAAEIGVTRTAECGERRFLLAAAACFGFGFRDRVRCRLMAAQRTVAFGQPWAGVGALVDGRIDLRLDVVDGAAARAGMGWGDEAEQGDDGGARSEKLLHG